LRNDFKHFGVWRDLNKHFWGDFGGKLGPNHPFLHFSQRWRCN